MQGSVASACARKKGSTNLNLRSCLRLVTCILLLCGLHLVSARSRAQSEPSALSLALLQRYLPQAASVTHSGQPPVWQAFDASGQLLAHACLTSPQADRIVGYAGPNNILILMDSDGRVIRTQWLSWSDTRDHVESVQLADSFWRQFIGWSLGKSNATTARLDGVSGATLTSLAIAEAIDLRLSGARASLRFPNGLAIEEVQSFFADAVRFEDDPQRRDFVSVHSASGQFLGWLLRTGPLVDDKIGYQGPVELIVALDENERISKIKLRSSFDNEPYVRYARMEASFWSKFAGRTLAEISQMDLKEEGIEGVSGATMTSMAAADTLLASAKRHWQKENESSEQASARRCNWSIGEQATCLLALLVLPWSLSRLRGHRRLRWVWQAFVLVVIVGISGNLISMALLAGWTRSLPPVTLAPGLSLLVAVCLIMPACFGRNVYCDHVCPHGFVQQWLARLKGSRTTVPVLVQIQPQPHATAKKRIGARKAVQWALKISAVAILLLSLAWIIWSVPNQLTFFEPFDVYAWRIGWSVSLGVWVASLLFAYKVPMGYCRLACPTGLLLDRIRWTRGGRHRHYGDMLLLALTASVWLLAWVG